MQLFLDSYGVHLGVRDGQFWVKPRLHDGRHFAVREVNVIFLTQGGSLTTDAMRLALENDIPVILLDYLGHPQGLWWNGRFGSTPLVRRNQALFAEQPAGQRWAAGWLLRKVEHQRDLLARLSREFAEHKEFQKKYTRALPVLNHSANRFSRWQPEEGVPVKTVAASFRGWEGTASKHYFRCLSALMPEKWRFDGRSFRPANDRFNSMLNYLYGILYAQVEVALLKAGLDPSMAVVHADQYNRPAMVFDFIEPFRGWADEVAARMCISGTASLDGFEFSDEKGFWLAEPNKGILIRAWFDFFNQKIPHQKGEYRRSTVIDLEAVALASLLKNL
jgi:CRISP-associated protein Cas1